MKDHFLRHTPPDPDALPGRIEATRAQLEAALRGGDTQVALDAAGNLVALLTAARREDEAWSAGAPHLQLAREHPALEESAWLLHHLATAAQYTGQRERANELFAQALQSCHQHGWRKLEHFVLHHWGRSRVEEGRFDEAQSCFLQSRAIRVELGHPLVQSSDKALAELARLRGSHAS